MVKTILKSSTLRKDHQFWGTELQETARFIHRFFSPDHGLELRSWLCTWTLSWKAPAFLELVARTNTKSIAMVCWDPGLNVRSCSHVKPTSSIQGIDPSLCVGSLSNISTGSRSSLRNISWTGTSKKDLKAFQAKSTLEVCQSSGFPRTKLKIPSRSTLAI